MTAEEALNIYGRHLDWCQKNAQMPTVQGRTYTMPTDWEIWKAQQPCTCKWQETCALIFRGGSPLTLTSSKPGEKL